MLTFEPQCIENGGWDHETIKAALKKIAPNYYALCDEIGAETNKHHIHLIIYRSPSAIRARTLRDLFPGAHQDVIRGTMNEARSYLLKEGKWAGTDKAETSIEGSFEESGEIPTEPGRGHRSDLETMMELVRDGYSDLDILNTLPSMVDKLTTIQRYRQLIIEERAHEFRHMHVIYAYGKTGAGKTRGVYESYEDPASIYTVSSYQGTGLFDGYDSSRIRVLCLDEFRSSLPFGLLLALTDGQYQIINCRYSNRIAVHTDVWIISNIPLLDQYPNIQQDEPESWCALLRRINVVRHFYDVGKYHDYTVEEYLHAVRYGTMDDWETAPDSVPFDPVPDHPESSKDQEETHPFDP